MHFVFFSIQSPIRWFFPLHILGGCLALATFVIPLAAKKGSRLHVRAGWVYVFAMGAVGFTAYVITPWRALLDPARISGSQAFAIFLMFIATLTIASLSHGLLAIKHKARTGPVTGAPELGPPIALLLAALLVESMGLARHEALFIAFPAIGALTAFGQLRYWLAKPTGRMAWWYAHMDGMGTACVATITAFLVTAVPRLVDHAWFHSPWLWISPGVILGTGLNRWTAYYRARLEPARVPVREPAPRAISP